MNYDFLQNYSIPRQSANNEYVGSNYSVDGAYGSYSMQSSQNSASAGVNTSYYGYDGTNPYNESYAMYYGKISGTENSGETYQHPERFMPPSKQGTGYVPNKMTFKRKYSGVNSGASAAKKEANFAEISSDGKFVIFMGRDESYPDELNALIHPLSCDLCNVKMNSRTSAKDHYESKVHDKSLTSWLVKNYTEKGLNPPTLKRFIKQGPSGPDAFYCEPCDLKLTSLTHANQHYAGKKHRLVVSQRAKPSGAGYYNSEGKWVRTGTKLTPQHKDRSFGIGELYKLADLKATAENVNKNQEVQSPPPTTTSLADTTTNAEGEVKTNTVDDISTTALAINPDQDPSLFCSICKVSVTSAVQMTMHLSGSKHMKKLKSSGINSVPAIVPTIESQLVAMPQTPVVDNVLYSAIKEEIKTDPTDLSMYRTPSGQYYCKTCNTSMSHLPGLEQHLKGKRHLKKLTEEKAMAALAAKKH